MTLEKSQLLRNDEGVLAISCEALVACHVLREVYEELLGCSGMSLTLIVEMVP
jgi:hypothetical protein